jgi:hypothetical protein
MPTTNVPFDLNAAQDTIDLSIQEMWIKSKADLKEYHKQYYYIEPVKDYIVKDSSLTAFSSFSKIPENGNIPADSPYQGFDKSYTQGFFSGMLRVTRAMWKYGIQTRKLENIVSQLKKDAIRFKEKVLANPLNNATSTTYTETTGKFAWTVTNSGGDGVAFSSTSHTREDGGPNWSNVLSDGSTNNMDFDYDALKAALRTSEAIVGGIGEELDININKMICKKNSSVHHRAMELMAALSKKENPLTANRDGSISFDFDIIAMPYLTSDTAYGFFDDSMRSLQYGLQLKEGMALQLDPQYIDYDTKEIKYTGEMDFAYGFNDPRNWIWSTGLNS